MKRQIEIFTASCPVCEPVVALVKETANENFEIILHNLSESQNLDQSVNKMNLYGVKSLPSIAVDGILINCCKNAEITRDDLVKANIGNY